jgi:ketosteroid isomerase-like protein
MRNGRTEEGVAEALEKWRFAVWEKDPDLLMPLYSVDALLFDVTPPLYFQGASSIREAFVEWFGWYSDKILYNSTQVQIKIDETVAIVSSIDNVKSTLLSGKETQHWLRHTRCLRWSTGKWLIFHQHASVPISFPKGDASLSTVALSNP